MSVSGIKYDDLEYWNDDNVDSDAYSKGKLFFFISWFTYYL